MKPIPEKWQKRLAWVLFINFVFVFIRLFRTLRQKPVWKPYLKECAVLFLSNLVLSLPAYLLARLIPQADLLAVLLIVWLTPVVYVNLSIWMQEHPRWLWI